jgi:hypothetical protein
VQDQRRGALRQAAEIAVTQDPARRVGRRLSRHRADGEAVFHRGVEQGHVVGLAIQRGALADPVGKALDQAQHRDLSAAQGKVVAHDARGDGRDEFYSLQVVR